MKSTLNTGSPAAMAAALADAKLAAPTPVNPVTAVFFQQDECLHRDETELTRLTPFYLVNTLRNQPLLQMDVPVEVMVYDDNSDEQEPLFTLTLSARLISGDYTPSAFPTVEA